MCRDRSESFSPRTLPLSPTKLEPRPSLPRPWPLSASSGHALPSSSVSSPWARLSPPSTEAMAPPTSFRFTPSASFNNGGEPSISTTTPVVNSRDGDSRPLSATIMPEITGLSSGSRAVDSWRPFSEGISRCSPADGGTGSWGALSGITGAHDCCGGGGPLFAEEV